MKTTGPKSRRTQITLDPEIHRRARWHASELGISLAEYLRRVVVRDLGDHPTKADPVRVFDLGRSGGSPAMTPSHEPVSGTGLIAETHLLQQLVPARIRPQRVKSGIHFSREAQAEGAFVAGSIQ